MYACMYGAVEALMCSTEAMEERLDHVMYGERADDFYEYFPPLFKAVYCRIKIPKVAE